MNDPLEDLRAAYNTLSELQTNLRRLNECLEKREYDEVDAELLAASQNVSEVKRQIEAAEKEIKARAGTMQPK